MLAHAELSTRNEEQPKASSLSTFIINLTRLRSHHPFTVTSAPQAPEINEGFRLHKTCSNIESHASTLEDRPVESLFCQIFNLEFDFRSRSFNAN